MKANKEIVALNEHLTEQHYDLIEKLNIGWDHSNDCWKKISKSDYDKNEKEINDFKNKLILFLEKTTEQKICIEEYENISHYSINDIVVVWCGCVFGKCEQIENLIIKDAGIAIEYADSFIKGRWDKFENNIGNLENTKINAKYLLNYCCHLNCEINEVEKRIFNIPELSSRYAQEVKKSRWKEAEPYILKNIRIASDYVCSLNFKWDGYENKIKNKPNRILEYARAIGGKLPDELHNRMMMQRITKECPHAEAYFDFIQDSERSALQYLKSISDEERQELLSKI